MRQRVAGISLIKLISYPACMNLQWALEKTTSGQLFVGTIERDAICSLDAYESRNSEANISEAQSLDARLFSEARSMYTHERCKA